MPGPAWQQTTRRLERRGGRLHSSRLRPPRHHRLLPCPALAAFPGHHWPLGLCFPPQEPPPQAHGSGGQRQHTELTCLLPPPRRGGVATLAFRTLCSPGALLRALHQTQ